MLHCSIFTAEIMLKKHGNNLSLKISFVFVQRQNNFLFLKKAWSKEILLDSWIQDPFKCCEKCGISNIEIDNPNSSVPRRSMEESMATSQINEHMNKKNNNLNLLDSNQVIARKLSGRYMVNKASTSLSTQLNKDVDKIVAKNAKKLSSSQILTSHKSSKCSKESLAVKMNSTQSSIQNLKSDSEVDLCCEICFTPFSQSNSDCGDNKNLSLSTSSVASSTSASKNSSDECLKINCGHKFCKFCWEQ